MQKQRYAVYNLFVIPKFWVPSVVKDTMNEFMEEGLLDACA